VAVTDAPSGSTIPRLRPQIAKAGNTQSISSNGMRRFHVLSSAFSRH